MKRLISVVLAAVLTVSLAAVMSVGTSASLWRKGDANMDGIVNLKDIFMLKSRVMEYPVKVDFTASDLNNDGTVNLKDIFYMKLFISQGKSVPDGYLWSGFSIGKVPVSEFEILVTDSDCANMCFAAQELQKYIKLGDGSDVNIAYGTSNAAHRIVFVSDTTGTMGEDGFNISESNGTLTITAAPRRGNMYAVYTLLEDYWGYRFYVAGEYELLCDGAANFPTGKSVTQIPKIRCRSNCMSPCADAYTESTVIKRKLNGCTDQPSMQKEKYGWGICRLWANAHSFDVFIPIDEVNSSSRCLSRSATYDVCLRHMTELVDTRVAGGAVVGKDITEISCSYAADEKYCTCRLCAAVYREERSYAGVLVRFVNKIDDALHERYPEIRVITNAYGDVRKPPAVTSLNDDVVLLYCWNGCSNHAIGSDLCSDTGNCLGYSNKVAEAYFNGWAEKCKQIYIWYYPTNIYYLLCPQANFFMIYDDFMWLTSQECVKGFYVVGTSGSSFEDLDAYLINRLMWETDMTWDEYDTYLKEYLKYSYGYGWTYIYEYMEMLEECGDLKGCVLNDFEWPFDIYSREYFADHFDEFTNLFELAKKCADTDREKNNIEMLSVHMRFLGYSATYERDYVNGTEQSREAFAEGWHELYDYINANNIRVTYDKRGIDSDFTLDVGPMQLVYSIDYERY